MKTTIFKPKPLNTKTKIIVSKEIVINLKLILLSLIITFIAFVFFYFTLKPNKQEIQNKITIEQERIADSIAKTTILDDSISKITNLQLLYDEVSKKYDIGTFYEFSKKMEIPEKRKIIFDECNKSLGLGFKDFKEFEYLFGFKEYDYKIIDLKQELRDFVATSNSCKYKTEEELLSKYPELKRYDIQSLRDYVATSNSGKYKTEEELNSKFPEFFKNFNKNIDTKIYKVDNDIYDIPINEVGGFLKEYPNAELIESDKILTSENILKFTEIEYVKQLNSFHKDLKDKTLFAFILSLFGLIIGRYFYILTNIAIKQLILLAKAIKKYSKMDVNQ